MVNLYDMLGIPEYADRLTIERAIRRARDLKEMDERYLKLAENYLLDAKRRHQYNKQMGIKNTARPKSNLTVGTDWRYVGGGIALVLVLFVPLVYVMFGQQKATEALYQQKNSEYDKAQEAMEKAWAVTPASDTELKHQAIERQLNEITQQYQEKLQQNQ